MSSVYSRQLYKGLAPAGFELLSGPPGTEVWILRSVIVGFDSGGQHVEFGVVDADFNGYPMNVFTEVIPQVGAFVDGLSIVLESGDSLYAYVDIGTASILASGYKLSLP